VIVAILKFVTEVISPKTDRTSDFNGAEIAFKGRLPDTPGVLGNGRGVPVEEALPQNLVTTGGST
jgi:hypothetical protein